MLLQILEKKNKKIKPKKNQTQTFSQKLWIRRNFRNRCKILNLRSRRKRSKIKLNKNSKIKILKTHRNQISNLLVKRLKMIFQCNRKLVSSHRIVRNLLQKHLQETQKVLSSLPVAKFLINTIKKLRGRQKPIKEEIHSEDSLDILMLRCARQILLRKHSLRLKKTQLCVLENQSKSVGQAIEIQTRDQLPQFLCLSLLTTLSRIHLSLLALREIFDHKTFVNSYQSTRQFII